jgi:hypothetical protein
MAYIDSEMAKRHPVPALSASPNATATADPSISSSTSHPLPADKPSNKQPQHHQLSEVDLGPSIPTSDTNTNDRPPRRPRKPRLGRDGKPLRPRQRKRRNSEDIARDALVEQVLHENQLENVYQSTVPNVTTNPDYSNTEHTAHPDAVADVDEAFAERFRQDFLDQVAERKQAQQQKKSTAQVKGPAGNAAVEKHGPKMGGSRSARAKLHQQQQQQQQQQGGAVGQKK